VWSHRRAAEQFNRSGLLVRNGTQAIPSPYLSVMNRQAELIKTLAAELGFTPISRARMTGTGPVAEPLTAPHAAQERDAPKQSLDTFLANAPRPTIN